MVYRPPFIKQLDGSTFGGRNCTVAASCMAAIRHQKGVDPAGSAQWPPTPKWIRAKMGDTSGGTTLAQNDAIFNRLYGINFDVRFNLPWGDFVALIKAGRGAVLQGSYSAFHGTHFDASGTFTGNHAVYINEMRYNAVKKHNEFLMYDPLADGRRNLYHGPVWIDEITLKKFAGGLLVSAGRRVGFGRCWAMFTRDTEPALVLKYHAVPYSRTLYARVAGARVRSNPNAVAGKPTGAVVRTLAFDAPFYARQKTAVGGLVTNSRVWYGDATGTLWVHSSVVKLTR